MNNLIFFDVETNGFVGSSVLSISAIKTIMINNNKLRIIDKYNRYYYRNPKELLNEKAIEVNKLTDSRIKDLRENKDYPLYFQDDSESFKNFCDNSVCYIAHNISFDKQFIPFLNDSHNYFCTMKQNRFIYNKWPKLSDTAKYYNIEVKEDILHDSSYDTLLCFKVFNEMFTNSKNNFIESIKYLLKN